MFSKTPSYLKKAALLGIHFFKSSSCLDSEIPTLQTKGKA